MGVLQLQMSAFNMERRGIKCSARRANWLEIFSGSSQYLPSPAEPVWIIRLLSRPSLCVNNTNTRIKRNQWIILSWSSRIKHFPISPVNIIFYPSFIISGTFQKIQYNLLPDSTKCRYFFLTKECNNQIIYFTTLTMLSPYRVKLTGLSLQVMLTIAGAKCHSCCLPRQICHQSEYR